MRLLTTTLQQWRAYRVHQAAEWLAASLSGEAPSGAARAHAPRDSVFLRAPELADLDILGLAAADEAG